MNWKRALLLCAVVFLLTFGGLAVYIDLQWQNDCPTTLSAYPADDENIPADELVAFENLTAEQQQQFEDALGRDRAEIDPSDWDANQYVRYDGENYSTIIATC
ncbi:hypothetical protein [Haloarchaeobius salinus]|uniref:hypothetical protein n=1 Tax=Haloarchaeobius salinus TaxID=1198298 RepID=UPI002108F7F9|nr:hypothetical protein [Haloarchaeobius salinus]